MYKTGIFLLAILALTGCGEDRTPLTHALAAFRSGDRNELLAAKAEAQEALKSAIKPGEDLCLMTMMDVERYGTISVIEKLDQTDIFRMGEDARLLYALKLAGKHLVIEPGSFLSHAPMFTAVSGQDGGTSCVGKKDKMMAALMSAGGDAHDADEARMVAMQSWMRDAKARYGEAFADHMRAAAGRLEAAGYGAPWPPQIDFIE